VEREIPLVSLFDVQTASRNFPLLNQAQILKQMTARAGRGGRGGAGRGQVQQNTQQNVQANPEVAETDPAAPPPRAAAPDAQRALLLQQLGEAYLRAPEHYPTANVLAHDDTVPDTHILMRGDFKNKGEKVEPGFLSALHPAPAIVEPKDVLFVPQRRKALALWLTSADNPLLGRVMVNRIWQGPLRRGTGPHTERFRKAGRAAHASRTAGLARRGVCGARLEHQTDAPDDHAFERLPRRRRGR